MGIQTLDIEIRGTRFHVTQLTATRSLKLLNKIGKVLGPALAHLGKSVDGPPGAGLELAAADIDFGELGAAFGALFDRLADDALFDAILRELLSGASVETEKGVVPLFAGASTSTFDAVFAEHPADAYKLARFALEVNYKDFFDGLAGLKGRVLAVLAARKVAAPSASGT